jgi:hypothetical protein
MFEANRRIWGFVQAASQLARIAIHSQVACKVNKMMQLGCELATAQVRCLSNFAPKSRLFSDVTGP